MVVGKYMNDFSRYYQSFTDAIDAGDIKLDNSGLSFPTGKAKLAERMAVRELSQERKLSPLEVRSVQDLCKVVDRILDWVYSKIFADYPKAKDTIKQNYAFFIMKKKAAEVPQIVANAIEKKADAVTEKVANTVENVTDKVFGFAKSIINPKKAAETKAT